MFFPRCTKPCDGQEKGERYDMIVFNYFCSFLIFNSGSDQREEWCAAVVENSACLKEMKNEQIPEATSMLPGELLHNVFTSSCSGSFQESEPCGRRC
jgi:hypothetical protein